MKRHFSPVHKLLIELKLVGPLRRLAEEDFWKKNYPDAADSYKFLHELVTLTPKEIKYWKIARKYLRPSTLVADPEPTRHWNRMRRSDRSSLRLNRRFR